MILKNLRPPQRDKEYSTDTTIENGARQELEKTAENEGWDSEILL